MIWLFIIGIIVVLMVTHYTVDEPRIKEQKNEQEKSEQEYIKSNHITVTTQYRYASDYYTQNINWTRGISYRFIVDEQNKKIHILSHNGYRNAIPFSDIIGCEIVSDNQIIGGIKRAIVGGVLAGETGALVGAMTAQPHIMSYSIVIYRSNLQMPTVTIPLIKEKVSTKSTDYTSAVEFSQKVLASIKAIIHING